MGLRLKTLVTSTLFINNPEEATPQNELWQEYWVRLTSLLAQYSTKSANMS